VVSLIPPADWEKDVESPGLRAALAVEERLSAAVAGDDHAGFRRLLESVSIAKVQVNEWYLKARV